MQAFKTVADALERAATLAIGQRVSVAGRHAEVVYGVQGKTVRFSTSHQTNTSRPDDGRKYIKGADVSGQQTN
jgi:hypothetical protein